MCAGLKKIALGACCMCALHVSASPISRPADHDWIVHAVGRSFGFQEYGSTTYIFYGSEISSFRVPLPLYVVLGLPVVGFSLLCYLIFRSRRQHEENTD